MTIKNDTEHANLIEGGKRLAAVLDALRVKVAPGVTAEELDDLAEEMIRHGGDEPCFLGYTPEGAKRPYPAALCVSVNDEVVHGIPNESTKVLKNGDIVGLDLGLTHNNIIVDAAITVPVGEVDEQTKKLLIATERALVSGIAKAVLGNHIGDIGFAIENYIEGNGFYVVEILVGHGVGYAVHEEPNIPNYGKRGGGPILKPGMVLAIEPMAALKNRKVQLSKDGFGYEVLDGSISAHFEHTVAVTDDGYKVLTK